jgi:fatty acid-binding protein DegV
MLGIDAPTGWLGSVVGAHAGPGAVAVAYFIK